MMHSPQLMHQKKKTLKEKVNSQTIQMKAIAYSVKKWSSFFLDEQMWFV